MLKEPETIVPDHPVSLRSASRAHRSERQNPPLKPGPRLDSRMPSVRADNKIGANFQFAARSFRTHTGHALMINVRSMTSSASAIENEEIFRTRGKKI